MGKPCSAESELSPAGDGVASAWGRQDLLLWKAAPVSTLHLQKSSLHQGAASAPVPGPGSDPAIIYHLGAPFLPGNGAHREWGWSETCGERARLELCLRVLPDMHGGHAFQKLWLGQGCLSFPELEARAGAPCGREVKKGHLCSCGSQGHFQTVTSAVVQVGTSHPSHRPAHEQL